MGNHVPRCERGGQKVTLGFVDSTEVVRILKQELLPTLSVLCHEKCAFKVD